MDKTPWSQLLRRNAVPFLVLAVAILVTAIATLYTAESIRQKDQERFEYAVQTTGDAIKLRLDTYVELLRGARGLFSSDSAVSKQEFHNYVSSLELDRYFPGVQGIGFTRRTAESGSTQHQQRIELIEPLNERNRSALGYDMFSEAVRREAMSRARDTSEPAMSGRVTLKQEIRPEKQAGFLVYLPIYRRGASIANTEQRRAALVGFVYSPFRADDFFAGILGRQHGPRVRLEVWDGRDRLAASMLHRTPSLSSGVDSRFEWVDVINYAGREWTVRYQPSIHFERTSSKSLVLPIAMGGIVISLLLFALTSALVRGRREAERI
ncbi:MAG: CHASE domain-containing protein, partial [Actinomycetota bacterium]